MIERYGVILIVLIIAQRLLELRLAAKHTKNARHAGAIEVDAKNFYWFYLLHAGFFASLLTEIWLSRFSLTNIWIPALIVFIGAQLLRIWSIATLGGNWNIRIFVIPGTTPVTRGPYRYVRHPNYLAVTLEILSLPLVFHAYVTAIVFSVLNFFILRRRISIEEAAWMQQSEYATLMHIQKRSWFSRHTS